MPELRWLVLLHAAVTLILVGLILTIQLVHYPLFDRVGADAQIAYQAAHQNAITLLVGPLMLAELGTAFLLLGVRPAGVPAWMAVVGLGLVGVIWLATLFLSVPQHSILASGFNQAAYRALVDSNWVRTIAWMLRGALVVLMINGMLEAGIRD